MNGGIISRIFVFLRLIRISNIVFLIYLQLALYWLSSKLELYDISILNLSQYSLFQFGNNWIIPSILTMALGNVANDYADYDSDVENNKRPSGQELINKSSILRILLSLSFILLLWLGLITYNGTIVMPKILIGTILLVLLYSFWLKCVPLIGNLVVALMCSLALSPFMIKIAFLETKQFSFLFGFLGFVFIITTIREIIKDLEDLRGDRLSLCETLPIKIGTDHSKMVVLALLMITSMGLSIWLSFFTAVFAITLVVLSIAPLFYIGFLLARTDDYNKISAYLKYLMISSSLLIFSFGLQYQQ